MGIFTKNFSCLSLIGAEKITFPPLCLRQTDGQTDGRADISNYRVASLLKIKLIFKNQSWFSTINVKQAEGEIEWAIHRSLSKLRGMITTLYTPLIIFIGEGCKNAHFAHLKQL